MADFKAYTLALGLTEQALTARNQAVPARYGGDVADDWQPYLTVACRLYWAKSESGRSTNRTYDSASREVAVTDGSLMLPLGTDIRDDDQITQVNSWDTVSEAWVLKEMGPMKILSVVNEHTHLEIGIERTADGA